MRLGCLALVCGVCTAASVSAQVRSFNRAEYQDRLRAMWLGQAIANWTGLRTEGRRQGPPRAFLTDDDWGNIDLGRGLVTFVLDQDPWQADDDTDIEYVYLHALDARGINRLPPAVIRNEWIDHINRYIWVSNEVARGLMSRGVLPPATGMGTANNRWLRIDAQLTTEFFGLLCPGMPDRALAMSELPIRTTSSGHATHASQVYAMMYSLAPQLPPGMPMSDRPLALHDAARRYIPDTSKAADIMDFIRDQFVRVNPSSEDWELTRDRIYERYQRDAALNGFRYQAWTESSINFATGILALLYGRGDYKRTVQIGTLSGWDSDNGTATMGALLGFMLGYDQLVAQFNPPLYPTPTAFSDRFWILRTRDNLPDYLPKDLAAEDTFTMMAARMIPIVEREIVAAGGSIIDDPNTDSYAQWLLPPPHAGSPLSVNPVQVLDARSANLRVRRAPGLVTATSNVPNPNPPPQRGHHLPDRFANGFEHDFSGKDVPIENERFYYSTERGVAPGGVVQLTVTYDRPVEVHTVRFIEGDHFAEGGWFTSFTSLELRIDSTWIPVALGSVVFSEMLDPAQPFQIIDIALPNTGTATGVRLTGPAGGPNVFVTCAELDCLAAP